MGEANAARISIGWSDPMLAYWYETNAVLPAVKRQPSAESITITCSDVFHHCQPSSVKRRRKYSHQRHGNVARHDRIAGLPDWLTKNLICLLPFNGCRWIVTIPAYALHVLRLQYRSLPEGCAMLIVVALGQCNYDQHCTAFWSTCIPLTTFEIAAWCSQFPTPGTSLSDKPPGPA